MNSSSPTTPFTKKRKKLSDFSSGYGSGKEKILYVAERLFGQRGINGVSLREIAVAAEQANNSAVALHFGDKEGLVHAIYETRAPLIDRIREKRLNKAGDIDQLGILQLLECLLLPWTDDIDEDGEHPYANFIAQLEHYGEEYRSSLHEELTPCAYRIITKLKQQLPDLKAEEFHLRMRLIISLFLSAIHHHGKVGFTQRSSMSEHHLINTIITMAVASLQA